MMLSLILAAAVVSAQPSAPPAISHDDILRICAGTLLADLSSDDPARTHSLDSVLPKIAEPQRSEVKATCAAFYQGAAFLSMLQQAQQQREEGRGYLPPPPISTAYHLSPRQ